MQWSNLSLTSLTENSENYSNKILFLWMMPRGESCISKLKFTQKWPLMSLIGMWEWVECFKHETTYFDVIFFKFIVFTNFSSKPTLECKLLFVVLGSINLLFSFRPGIFKISEIIGQESTYPSHRRVFLVKNRPKCLKIKCLENK